LEPFVGLFTYIGKRLPPLDEDPLPLVLDEPDELLPSSSSSSPDAVPDPELPLFDTGIVVTILTVVPGETLLPATGDV
jgi:hypothetical protein